MVNKKVGKSNWQFDSWPLKVNNHLDFLACRWCVTYHWKTLDKGYNLALDVISIKGFHAKLEAPKVVGVPSLGISRLPLANSRTKWHSGVGIVARHKVYYKGEGCGFPQVQAVVSLLNLCLPVIHLCTKVLQLCTNQFVVWFV
jgi:hypothetical protein